MDLVWEDIFKLLLTAFLAILIGYDREKRNKAAGVRTNLIVAVISCLIIRKHF
ncbi:MAG: MgtC/SapB family protein [Bacillota bacterium]